MRFPRLLAPSASQVRRHPGCRPVAAFRPQVFATSRRLSPCQTLRACFIPLAPAGFPLQGFSFSRSRIASRRPLPSCRYDRPASRFQVTRQPLVFRALLPRRRPPLSVTRLNTTVRGALLGFYLSRVFLPSAVGRLSAPLPSRASMHAVRDVATSAPQGVSGPRESCVSRETTSPLEVSGLFDLLIHSRAPPDLAHFFTSGPISRCHDTGRPSSVRAGSLPELDEMPFRPTSF